MDKTRHVVPIALLVRVQGLRKILRIKHNLDNMHQHSDHKPNKAFLVYKIEWDVKITRKRAQAKGIV